MKNVSIAKIKKIFPLILRANYVRRAYLFGSFSRGKATRQSDIDLALTFSRTPSLFELSALQHKLSEAVDTPVDLVLEQAMHPHIRATARKDYLRIV